MNAFTVKALALVLLAGLLMFGGCRWQAKLDDGELARLSERATAAEDRSTALSDALARDAVADGFTNTARGAMDSQAAETNQRLARLEGRINDRTPVPAVCPVPDPGLLRESAEAAGRIRAAEGRLRDLRTPEG